MYKTIKWENFINQPLDEDRTGQIQTTIECPDCGRMIYIDTRIILTSYPAKYSYWCTCGWHGYAPHKWQNEAAGAS